MSEEANVEEVEYAPNADEQSAAWCEVARDALTLVKYIAWMAWSYLMFHLASELIIAWIMKS